MKLKPTLLAMLGALFSIVLANPAPAVAATRVASFNQGGLCTDTVADDGKTGCVWVMSGTTGGGSGGGGGAVTAASGSYVAGSIVDIGTGASPAANTLNARLITINTTLGTPLQAGGNVILSSGSTTIASQGTASQLNAQVVGAVGAASSDSTNPVKVGCVGSSSGQTAVSVGQKANFGCDLDGSLYVAGKPTTSPVAAIAPTTTGGTSVTVLKASAGNLYSLNWVNSTTAACIVAYDSATTPTAGASLTASLVRFALYVAASSSDFRTFVIPLRFTAGIQLLGSTNCTTYTATSPLQIYLTGQAL